MIINIWRWLSALREPKETVLLCIVRDTNTGAILSSDYAECRVNEQKFRRLNSHTASMLLDDARACGLDDDWT
jgi:hypothetical protein